jgi:Putative peptidoglycan-binding domain-containing protein
MQRRGWNLNKWLPSGNDGKYGPEYAGLTLAFQKDQGLDRDGLLGEQTWMRAFHGQVS